MSKTRTFSRMEALRRLHPTWPTADLRAVLHDEVKVEAQRLAANR